MAIHLIYLKVPRHRVSGLHMELLDQGLNTNGLPLQATQGMNTFLLTYNKGLIHLLKMENTDLPLNEGEEKVIIPNYSRNNLRNLFELSGITLIDLPHTLAVINDFKKHSGKEIPF